LFLNFHNQPFYFITTKIYSKTLFRNY